MSGAFVHEPAGAIRAHAEPGGRVRLHCRNHTLVAEGQGSHHAKSEHPSALDYLLAALAADLVAGFGREAARAGIRLDAVELSLAGRLENPLVALGVIGEQGSARLAEVRGRLYVSAEAAEPDLHPLWRQALARAPVHSTLARCAAIDIELKLVP